VEPRKGLVVNVGARLGRRLHGNSLTNITASNGSVITAIIVMASNSQIVISNRHKAAGTAG
jgi:hypothetical protein